MARSDLETRVANLEADIAAMKRDLGKDTAPTKDWRAIIGTFADDPIFEEAMELGRAYRESQRPKPSKRRNARS
jgi:hypothetical protein